MRPLNRPLTNPRRLALATGVLLGLVAGAILGVRLSSPHASGSSYLNTLDYGAPITAQSMVPGNLDVQIHRRSSGDSMDAMAAQHGVDCGAPPATHMIDPALALPLYLRDKVALTTAERLARRAASAAVHSA